jgi:hypothetical protein
MANRRNRSRRPVRPAIALARPMELFGDSLPELALFTAVVAAVAGALAGLGAA